jgi:hypothetical protein
VSRFKRCQGDLERVEYLLECAQFMASNGLPRADIRLLLQEALDALLEVEGLERFPGLQEMEDDELELLLQRGNALINALIDALLDLLIMHWLSH